MPFSSLTLKPGVNVEATPAALRAGYSQSNLGRFRSGFFEKLGGWAKYYAFSLSGVPLPREPTRATRLRGPALD